MVVDKEGIVWFSEFADNALGRLDPKTGKVAEYTIPRLKQDDPMGTLNLEMGPDGNLLAVAAIPGRLREVRSQDA